MASTMEPPERISRTPSEPTEPHNRAERRHQPAQLPRNNTPWKEDHDYKVAPAAQTMQQRDDQAHQVTNNTINTRHNQEDRTQSADAKGKVTVESRQQQNAGDILIMSLNVNGLRQKRKVTALGGYISSLKKQPDVCILIETHLTEAESDNFQ